MSDSFQPQSPQSDPNQPDPTQSDSVQDQVGQIETTANFPPHANTTTSKAFDVFLWVALALGVCLRFVWMGKRELWYDEVLSVILSSGQKNNYKLPKNIPFSVGDFRGLLDLAPTQNVSGAIEGIKNVIKGTLGDPHPPLFYLGEHGWMGLFGNGEAALRSLVVLISVAALALSYGLGRRVLGHRGGLIFATLLSLNPFVLAHSLNLRMYANMVFWTLASGLAFITILQQSSPAYPTPEMVNSTAGHNTVDSHRAEVWKSRLLKCGVIVSITAGLLTQYLFTYWLFALAALALYLDRKYWFRNGLILGAAVLQFMPWVVWGVRQQINNRSDVLNQISFTGGPVQSALAHGKDLAQTVANYFVLGHLTTGMQPISESIKPTAVVVGCGVIGFVVMCMVTLYRHRQYKVLMISAILGLVPLAIALTIDVIAGKYALGFGWGRSTIVALPGCVLLLAAWLEFGVGRWREVLTVTILAVYLLVNVGEYELRDRQMFHQVLPYLPENDSPTLVAMDSQAWGYVLRLVYYIDNPTVDILATAPSDMTGSLKNALAGKDYSTVVWLHPNYPLWAAPESEEAATAFKGETEQLLQSHFDAIAAPRILTGTTKLDQFELQPYKKAT